MKKHLVQDEGIKVPSRKVEAAPDDVEVSADSLPKGIKLTGGEKLRSRGLTGEGVRVAVIDSGVDETHPGFNNRVLKQMWFRAGTDLAEDDHGTHVAGTINMMAPDAEIYDYRVFGAEGGFTVDEAIVASIYEAVLDKCDVINMSLGGRWPSSNIRTAILYAHKNGVVVVCAAGNEGDGNPLTNERSFPALWDEVISIAAVAKEDDLPIIYFSNTNPQVDFAGIGVDVLSYKPGGGYHIMSGTSMACPHVAGLIAAILSGKPDIGKKKRRKNQLSDLLKDEYLIDIGDKGKDVESGHGFLTALTKEEFDEMF